MVFFKNVGIRWECYQTFLQFDVTPFQDKLMVCVALVFDPILNL